MTCANDDASIHCFAVTSYEFLRPLFERIDPFVGDGQFKMLPRPEDGSSLATEDALLGGWRAFVVLSGATNAGISHVYFLRRMVADLNEVDPIVPWTLLRSALEDFALCVWLLHGSSRNERLTRTLRVWAHDLWERGNYDQLIQWQPTGNGKSAADRREDVKTLAKSLGLSVEDIFGRWSIGKIIRTAATETDLDANAMEASWRVGSGFAHGRMWPIIRASEATQAAPIPGGALVGLVMDDDKLRELADHCLALLNAALKRYEARRRR